MTVDWGERRRRKRQWEGDARAARCALKDITAKRESADMTESSDKAEPIENADPTEPIEPIENADPTEPIDTKEPFDPIESIEFSDQRDQRDAVEEFTEAIGHYPTSVALAPVQPRSEVGVPRVCGRRTPPQ